MRRKARSIALLLSLSFLLTACGKVEQYPEYQMASTEQATPATNTDPQYNTAQQLTVDDIQAMNDGNAIIEYNEDGYVTTIVGKFYDGKITNYNDAIPALYGISNLIGLNAGADFYAVYGETDSDGNTYFLYEQRYGSKTLKGATLKIIINEEGEAVGLSNSFFPNVGTVDASQSISYAEAETIVQNAYPNEQLYIYTESTHEISIMHREHLEECIAVYTKNTSKDSGLDMPYTVHMVSFSGKYLTSASTNNLEGRDMNAFHTEDYFKKLEPVTLQISIPQPNGTVKDLEVPIAYDRTSGLYYLADTERMIMTANYANFIYQDKVTPAVSSTGDDWDYDLIMAHYNIIRCYDFYANLGFKSTDGMGNPILILEGCCEEDGTPIDNAYYIGVLKGWSCICFSEANKCEYALDVIGHEYTHGITGYSMGANPYINDYGAINEAYSDIMGSLIELYYDDTEDTQWLICENGSKIYRNMSNPNEYQQPGFVGDVYYVPPTKYPDGNNDSGGVHRNSSLLNAVAYNMYASGVPLDDMITLWFRACELMTAYSSYQDVYACLCYSARSKNLNQYEPIIRDSFEKVGLLGDWRENYKNTTKPGCGRIYFEVKGDIAKNSINVVVEQKDASLIVYRPDENNIVTGLVPEGAYLVHVLVYYDDGSVLQGYWTGSGWSTDIDSAYVGTMKSGDTIYLTDLQ